MAEFLRSKIHQLCHGSKFLLIIVLSASPVWHMSKFSKITWGKCYNQVFLYCTHIYQQFLLVEGQKNRFFAYNFCYVGYNLLPNRFSYGSVHCPSFDVNFMKILDDFTLWQRQSLQKTAIFQRFFFLWERNTIIYKSS